MAAAAAAGRQALGSYSSSSEVDEKLTAKDVSLVA
jgi:hypothetical protein